MVLEKMSQNSSVLESFQKMKFLELTNQMAGNWNEPLPLMDAAMCERMKRKTDEYLTLITWRNNGTASSLVEAVQIAKMGQDIGQEATLALRPTGQIFEDWINWNNLVTFLVNRDTGVRTLLSAYRNAIICTRYRLSDTSYEKLFIFNI